MSIVTRRNLAALLGVSALALTVPTMVMMSPGAEAAAKKKKKAPPKKKKAKSKPAKPAENESEQTVATAEEAARN
jgi:hypothetical protein